MQWALLHKPSFGRHNPSPGQIYAAMLPAILEALGARKNKLLLLAQASLTQHQFVAFRTLLLDELGQKGLEGELVRILAGQKQGVARNGRE